MTMPLPGFRFTKRPNELGERIALQPLADAVLNSIASQQFLLDSFHTLRKHEQYELNQPSSQQQQPNLVYIRILGYLIIYCPHPTGQQFVAQFVKDNETNYVELLAKGKFYMHVSKYKNPPSATTTLTTADAYDPEKAKIRGDLQRAPRNHKEAKAKALYRESHRCAITGDPDLLVQKYVSDQIPIMVNTRCAHIFPESLGLGLENPAKAEHVSHFWDILRTFGYTNIHKELDGQGIHRLENVMTIDSRCHDLFDTLNLWLEETDIPNVYRPCGTRVLNLYGEVTEVTFDTDDPVNLPVPSPEYLRIHAACCRIARMSGAADYVEDYWREFEDMSVLSADGASADLLHFALETFSYNPDQVTVH